MLAQRPLPGGLQLQDGMEVRRVIVVDGLGLLTQTLEDGLAHGLCVAHDAHLDRVVLADLSGVEVDLDELGRRDGEADARAIGRGGLVSEPASDGQDDVRAFSCGFIIRGFDIDEATSLDASALVNEVELQTGTNPWQLP